MNCARKISSLELCFIIRLLQLQDRFNRKRLLTKRVHLSDLAASKETRDALRKRQYREIVVYDQSTVELDKLAPGHPLFLALSSLVEENREPAVLIGTFHNKYSTQIYGIKL
jgi:dual specificity phosphatase 10